MKKIFVSLITAIILVSNIMISTSFANGLLSHGDEVGAENYGTSSDRGHAISQNDKYIFITESLPVSGLENTDIRMNSKVHIYEKPNEEHFDFKYLTTQSWQSSSSSRQSTVNTIEVFGDVLYVTFGNTIFNIASNGAYPSPGGVSPTFIYDVSNITAGDNLTEAQYQLSQEGTQRNVANQPFVRGFIGYLDEETGRYYVSRVESKGTNYRTYGYMSTDDAVSYFADGSSVSLSLDRFTTGLNSKNAVQFIVNDGFLFEVLQQNCGFTTYSGDKTLVDAQGNEMNNTIYIYDWNAAEEDGKTSGRASIESYKRGTYTTEKQGDVMICDIAVSGNTMYLATKKGLEVVNIEAAKTGEEDAILSLDATLLEETVINGVEVCGENLYVGSDAGMYIYDVVSGAPELIASYEYEGGFSDFDLDEEKNVLYALSELNKGVVVIDLYALEAGISVTSFAYSEDENAFEAKVTNEKGSVLVFDSVYTLYKNGKLFDASIKSWEIPSGEELTVADSFDVGYSDEYSAKVMFTASGDITNVLPMVTADGIVFEQTLNETVASAEVSADSLNIADMDETGNVLISGTVPTYINKPIAVVAKNNSASAEDRLDGLRYFDILTPDAKGEYALNLKPQDSGEYEVKFAKPMSYGNVSKTINVADASVKVENGLEIPGVSAFLYLSMENGQNMEKFDIELTFDENNFEVGTEFETSDSFTVSDVLVENGTAVATFTKTTDVTATSNEFCLIPIEIKPGATIGLHEIGISANAKNEFGDEIVITAINGTLTLEETSEKYQALSDAIDALKAVKKADEITVDDYLEEKAKAEVAREKSNYVIETYEVRESQLGVDLLNNLTKAHAKLLEIAPYYEAVDKVNAEPKENVVTLIKENKDFFELSDREFVIYDTLEEKSSVDEKMADRSFVKPSDINSLFIEALVLEAFDETRWSGVEELLEYAKNSCDLSLISYNKLTNSQKAAVCQSLALTEYEDMEDLEDALQAAVSEAEETTTSGSGSQNSSGGGSSKGSSGKTVWLSGMTNEANKAETPTVTPAPDKAFKDIEAYGWAEDAIMYLYDNGVVNGKANGIYAPADNVKREEFAKMIALAFDIKGTGENRNFKDVSNGAWYEEYISALASVGIINGRDDGSFGVGDYITREEIAVILDRVAQAKNIEITVKNEASPIDSDEISNYAVDSVLKMCKGGIISGFGDGSIRPKDAATRAQVAQLIYNVVLLVE